MAQYVDGFVVPVPKGKIDEYRQTALALIELLDPTSEVS